MQALKQSTAATILVGPVLDASGVAVTTAVIGDFSITKNGTSAAMSGNTIAHSHNGHYTIALTTGNTDTLGRLTISVNNSAMAMAPYRYTVLAAAAFDTLVTNGTLASTTSGRTIDVSAGGEVGIDWANIGSPTTAVALTGTTISSSQVAASVTGNVGGNVTGSVGSLAAQAKADVNTEVVDALSTDTYAELSAPPAATSSLKDKLTYVFQWLRNKSTQTSSQRKLYADDGTTVVATETTSDDGTTYTKGEAA